MATERSEFLPTRRTLLSRLRNPDNAAEWQEFHDRYRPLLHSLARGKGLTETEAEDVVQETLISVARTMPQFRYQPEHCSFKGWLRHLAEKRIADAFRRRARALPGAPERGTEAGSDTGRTAWLDRIPDPAGNAAEAISEAEWQRGLYEAALARVKARANPKQFKIFHRLVVQNFSARAVAADFGVSLAQVYLARHRIGARLKREVKSLERAMKARRN
jgi:RNA polymerase sigma-70 factor (ECF subfamily)